MKKSTKIITLALGASLLIGCAGVTGVLDDVIAKVKALVGIEVEEASNDYVAPEGATQVTGLVLTAYGNEITLQLVQESAGSSSGMQGGSNMMQGELAEGEMPEGMAEGGMSGGMGEMPEGMTEGGRSGGMGEMSGGMDASASVDYSATYTLSDETQLFVIPTGTIVEYYSFEMTFSQIEAAQYITITISEEGNILYVEVLG